MDKEIDLKETKAKLSKWFNYILAFGLLAVSVLIFGLISNSMNDEKNMKDNALSSVNDSVKGVVLRTNKGAIEIDFYHDQAPNTVNNFIKLAEEGFYDGTRFHRIVNGFMIQGGDPLSKDVSKQSQWGTGGPGYTFADEITADNHNEVGTIAMANSGPNTNGSQFFINLANNSFLDRKHTVFGKVIKGMDIVEEIANTQVKANAFGEESLPVEDIIIEKVVIK